MLTFLTGFVPALMAASAAGAMVSLIVVRLLLGATNAPMFPVTAGAFANWFPAGALGVSECGTERRPDARAGSARPDRDVC